MPSLPRSFASIALVACTSLLARTSLAADAGAADAGAGDAGPVATSVMSWDAGAAIIGGTACMKGIDAFALSNGSDFSVVFANLGVALDENAGGDLTERQTCTVRMPASVPEGFYASQITQRYQYGARTTEGASGGLSASVLLFGLAVNPLTLSFPFGAPVDVNNQVESRTDAFQAMTPWFAAFCRRGRAVHGSYNVNFTATGERRSSKEVALLFVDGLGLRYDVQTVWSACTR